MTYKVRGPCPDGDYFIVEVIDGEETPLDETFRSEEEAIVGIEMLEAVEWNPVDVNIPIRRTIVLDTPPHSPRVRVKGVISDAD